MPSQQRVADELQDRYRIERVLGRGGTAVVYEAQDLLLGRPVAIKVLRPGPAADEDGLGRLLREAHTVAKLQHPNIVQLYDVRALDDDGLALIMQYASGATLKHLIHEKGAFSCRLAGRILVDVGRALSYAHAQKIVHRDVKPDNVYFDTATGVARLSDFGIARRWGGASTLTLPGSALGTPAYMSPEQIDGEELDGRSDIYSLALLGYELLTGSSPWKGDTLFSILEEQKRRIPPLLADVRPDVPEHLSEAIGVALRKKPEERWPDADTLIEHILSAPLPDTPAPPVSESETVSLEDAPTVLLRRGGDRRAKPRTAEGDLQPQDVTLQNQPPLGSPAGDAPRETAAQPASRGAAKDPGQTGRTRRGDPEDDLFLGFALAPPPPGAAPPLPEGTEYYTREEKPERAVHRNTIVVTTDVSFANVMRFDPYRMWVEGTLTFEHGDCGGSRMRIEPAPFVRTRRGKLKPVEADPEDEVALVCSGCDRRLGGMTRLHFEEAVMRFLARPYPSALEAYRLTEEANLVAPGWKPPRRRKRPDRRAPDTRYDVDPSLMGRRRRSKDRRREPGLLDFPPESEDD